MTLCGSVLGGSVRAQDKSVIPKKATPDEVNRWLTSGDPRMVAWGAFFAGKDRDREMLLQLQRLAEEWVPAASDVYTDYWSLSPTDKQRDAAMTAVLDALIQMHGTIPPEAINRLAGQFLGQAMTLFAYLPETPRRELAMSIYARRVARPDSARDLKMEEERLKVAGKRQANETDEPYDLADMVHVAAAILANDPPPGFAASLLQNTTVAMEGSVGGSGKHDEIGLGGVCGDEGEGRQLRGWPERSTSVVEESYSPQVGEEVIVPGIVSLTTRRAGGSSSCSFLKPFGSFYRMELIAQLLGTTRRNLGWSIVEYAEVTDTDEASHRAAVLAEVAARERAFESTAEALVAKGLMTEAEALNSRPTLEVTIKDRRSEKTAAPPAISFPWPKTSVHYAEAR